MSNSSKSLIPALILFLLGTSGILLTAKPEPIDVRILTYNIRLLTNNDTGSSNWSERKEFLADTMRDESADLLCVQEAFREQLDFIGTRVAGYTEVGVGREDGDSKGEYSAILYKTHRFELIDSGTFWLSDEPDVPNSMTWGNNVTRICTWARLEERESGRRLDVFNTHFDHQSEEARRRAMALIATRIDARPGPKGHVILAGDFNADESSWAFRYITGAEDVEALPDYVPSPQDDPISPRAPVILRDTFRAIHPEASSVGTFHGFSGKSRGGKIDHIFVEQSGNRVLKADIWRVNRDGWFPSDHFPVRATVRFW